MSENTETAENHVAETISTENKESSVENLKMKKTRRRKKALHTSIKNQMEFYFSDANLSKDRFMQNAIKEGSEMKLETFLSFNKMRTLTGDVKEIAKALKYSSKLRLSEDETMVSRTTLFLPKSQEEVDNCTIYVEQLPSNANHEWVKELFTEFGTVAYISLPKFKDLTKIKGFAFVEFDSADQASKAVNAFSTPDSYSKFLEDPGKLCTIHSFNSELLDENCDVDNEPPKKKLKMEELSKKTSIECKEGGSKKETEEEENKNADSNYKREIESRTSLMGVSVHQEAQSLSLQAMSKKDWKKLRNKYLDMQRKTLRQMRVNLKQEMYNKRHLSVKKLPSNEVMNTEVSEIPLSIQENGLIVKIVLDEPILDAKRFKNQVKCQDGVSYVEAEDCHTVAFVRCTDSKAAQTLVDKKIWQKAEVLEGVAEKEYWSKIEENRIKKRVRSSRPKKSGAERNRQKKEINIDEEKSTSASTNLLQHIRFSDEEPSS